MTDQPAAPRSSTAPTAAELAAAMDVPPSDLVSASIGTSDPLGTEVWDQSLSFFPTRGSSFTILSTGLASSADDPDDNNDEKVGGANDASDDKSYILGGLNTSKGHDLVQLTLTLEVPQGFGCFLFDFAFFSEEMPDWIGNAFNDTFIAELGPPGGASTFTIEGSEVVAPNNVAFDPRGRTIDVNSGFGFDPAVPNPDTGTTYDGTSGLLSARAEVTPGTQVDLVFSIMDLGDSIVDSAVFLDNFRWTIDPPRVCRPGAVPANIDYFAVGDSVASGHGLLDGPPCRRSDLAYPHKFKEALRGRYGTVTFLTTACSGATASGSIVGGGSLADQVEFVLESLTGRPTLVSITIGSDDFHWTPSGGWRAFLDTWARLTAAPRSEFSRWVRSRIRGLERQLRIGARRLLRHENVSVVITQHHNPFNTRSLFFRLPGSRCREAPEFTSAGQNTIRCYRRTEFVVHRLNRAERAVRRDLEGSFPGRLALAAVHKEFHGHESPGGRSRGLGWRCGTARPRVGSTWIQHPQDRESNSFPFANARKWFTRWLETVSRTGTWRGDCHHPNERGARAFAEAVNDAALAMGL